VTADSVLIEGDWSVVQAFLIKHCDVPQGETEFALSEMRNRLHDVASIGVDRTVVCTFKAASSAGLIAELRAIDDVRREFHQAYTMDPSSIETKIAARNLQSLYISLNVQGVLDILDPQHRETLSQLSA
jgi:hypothetical protein